MALNKRKKNTKKKLKCGLRNNNNNNSLQHVQIPQQQCIGKWY